jgi:hypothetical protein
MEADVPAGWWDNEVFGAGWTEVDGGGFSKWVGCESRYIWYSSCRRTFR